MFSKYNALVRCRRIAPDHAPSGCGPSGAWNPMKFIYLPAAHARDSRRTLGRHVDLMAYQLFRDGLLPTLHNVTRHRSTTVCLLEQQLQKIQRDEILRLEAEVEEGIKNNKMPVREGIERTALVIGCDEVGVGSAAGPVVAAAFCRVPVGAFKKSFDSEVLRSETFAIFDSKQETERDRQNAFVNLTGFNDIFEASRQCGVFVHSSDASEPIRHFSSRSDISDAELCVPESAHHFSIAGLHTNSLYHHYWCISVGSNSFGRSVLEASQSLMHSSAVGVWTLLNERKSLRSPTFAKRLEDQYLRCCKKEKIEFGVRSTAFGAAQACQPPLLLVDGDIVPEMSVNFFSELNINGAVHPIVKGDTRSYSVAAASNLAKVSRDGLMVEIGKMFPQYGFARHKGYPTLEHKTAIRHYGVSPVHRIALRASYTPRVPEEVSVSVAE